MEVIAKKRGGLFGLYFIVAILGGLSFAGSLIGFFASGENIFILPGILALSVAAVGIGMLVSIKKTPDVIISYDHGKLYFADGLECTPRDLTNVTYRRASGRGIQYAWGTLTVTVNGVEHSYHYTAEVVAVHDRLIELMLQARENNNG